MKSSKSIPAETAAVNKEPEVADLNRLREGRGPTFTQIANVNKEPEAIDLKRLREGRGLTLKDIFSATRITVTNLEAIEAGTITENRYHFYLRLVEQLNYYDNARY